jgi:hypothetical protein
LEDIIQFLPINVNKLQNIYKNNSGYIPTIRLDAIIIVYDNFNEVIAVCRAQNISGDAKYRAPSSIIYQR